MNKISYEILVVEVDKLYRKEFAPGTKEEVIAEYCEYIATFIESCGWKTDDFVLKYVTDGLKDLNPPKINPLAN